MILFECFVRVLWYRTAAHTVQYGAKKVQTAACKIITLPKRRVKIEPSGNAVTPVTIISTAFCGRI